MRYLPIAGLLLVSLTACGAAGPVDTSASIGQHSKELTITDESGANMVFIKLTSDDSGALAAYREDSFTLVPSSAEEAGSDGEATPSASVAHDTREAVADSAATLGVSLAILGEELAAGVTGYRLVDNIQANYRDPFVVVYMPSPSGTSNDCVEVARLSDFNKVYVTVSSQQQSGDPWVTILSETDVRKSSPVEACDYGSYRVRARIERRQANDYSFSSHN